MSSDHATARELRVARAIHAEVQGFTASGVKRDMSVEQRWPWTKLRPAVRRAYRSVARAAMKAMKP